MFVLLTLMALCVVALIATGAYLEMRPESAGLPRWARGGFALNQLLMFASLTGLLILGIGEVFAQEPTAAEAAREYTLGFGLAVIGVGLPTGLAAIASAIALGPVGSAALAVLAEKPDVFGRTLVYLGLAEGIAIYGLVVSILMLGKI